MHSESIDYWLTRLDGIRHLDGVTGLSPGKIGIVVEIEERTPKLEAMIMRYLERNGAAEVPYRTQVVGRAVGTAA